jgi:hypothetical protein
MDRFAVRILHVPVGDDQGRPLPGLHARLILEPGFNALGNQRQIVRHDEHIVTPLPQINLDGARFGNINHGGALSENRVVKQSRMEVGRWRMESI